MARIRSIKPEFWSDQKLAAQLTREQRLFYVALWNEADDQGRLLANPRRLLGIIFPFDSDIHEQFIEDSLRALAATGRVVLYEVDGTPYAQLTKFADHQRINRPTESRIPSPDSELATTHGGLSEDSVSPQPLEVGAGEREVGVRSRGSTHSPRETNGDVEKSDPLFQWLNGHGKLVADCPLLDSPAARLSLHANFGPPEMRANAWKKPDGSAVPHEQRPRILAAAVLSYAGEGKREIAVSEFSGLLRRTIRDEYAESTPGGRKASDLSHWED